MNVESSYSSKAETSFVKNPSKFKAAAKANKYTFRRLIVVANLISTFNCLGYYFGYVGELNFWRTEIFAVQLSKMLAEIGYKKFGLDLFVHHVCMFLFFFLVPQRFLWLGPQGNLIHVPLLFQNLYFICRHDVKKAKLYSGLFWCLWLPVVAYRSSVAFFLGCQYLMSGQAFGRVLMGLGALGATLDVFWTREFISVQLKTIPDSSEWARTAIKFHKSPICIMLLLAGAFLARICVYNESGIPRVQLFVGIIVCVLGLNWKNISALGAEERR